MLIKQWDDVQAARHVMDNEDELQKEPPTPEVTILFHSKIVCEQIVVLPASMAVVLQPLEKVKCGEISVRYPTLEPAEYDEDFDEDEQLYSAASTGAFKRNFPDLDVPLYTIPVFGGEKSVLGVIVPHFTNPIAEKAVARQIATLATNISAWLVLAPCQLNNGSTISKLDLGARVFPTVPLLQPPHFVTGISAAVVSALNKRGTAESIGVLALNSEGHVGYEKVDADSIIDASEEVFKVIFGAEKAKSELNKVSGVVRKVNSASTSGMYL